MPIGCKALSSVGAVGAFTERVDSLLLGAACLY